MDIFLNQLIQFYSSSATNLHHLTSQYAVLPHYIEIVILWPQITVASLGMVNEGWDRKFLRETYTLCPKNVLL